MKKYIVLWVFGLVLPLFAAAQVNHQLHFAYGLRSVIHAQQNAVVADSRAWGNQCGIGYMDCGDG